MEERAYVDLHRLERTHWWYRGTRAVYRTLLRQHVPRPCGPVLDLGCGTGGNLALLSHWGPVIGLDPWLPALRTCPSPDGTFVQGQATTLPFPDRSFGLVAILGVIEHVADDVRMLREVRRVCRREGKVLLLTSAFRFLWSHHDVANRHVRRYTARELRAKVARAGLRVRTLSYQNFFLFPLAAPIRTLQRLCPPSSVSHVDMFPVPEPANTILARLLALEGWMMRWVSLPVGVSLVAVLER